MKAAQLYQYDQEMNVDLVVETVPEPTIKLPRRGYRSCWRGRFVPY